MEAVIGVDIGGTSVKLGIVHGGKVCKKTVFETPAREGAGAVARRLAAEISALAAASGAALVGVGMPGIIDSEKGAVLYSNNIPAEGYPLGEELRARTGLACHVLNDANAAAVAEWKFGAGRGANRVVLFTLGTGVGCGVVLGEPQVSGRAAFAAGGHIVIREGGRRCTCGSRGCMEMYASASALVRDAKRLLRGRESCLAPRGLTAKQIFSAAQAGDAAATAAVRAYAGHLAAGVTSVYNLFFPEAVLLGGGVGGAGEYLAAQVERLVKESIYVKQAANMVCVRPALLGNDAGMIGAAEFARGRERGG